MRLNKNRSLTSTDLIQGRINIDTSVVLIHRRVSFDRIYSDYTINIPLCVGHILP